MENIKELTSLQSQVKAVRLQDKKGKQNFHEHMKKVFGQVTDIIKVVSKDITKTITGTSIETNRALHKLNNKFLQAFNNRGKVAAHLLPSLSKITSPEHTSQCKRLKDPHSNQVNDLLLSKTKPVSLYHTFFDFL